MKLQQGGKRRTIKQKERAEKNKDLSARKG